MSETKRQVLQMLHNGAITAAEAARLLDAMRLRPQVPPAHAPAPVAEAGPAPEVPESHALEAEPALETARAETDAPHAGAPAMSDRLARARALWRFPFGVGLLVMGVAALGMVTNYDNLGYISLTFVGLWGVFVGAALLVVIGLWARTAAWMVLDVRARNIDFHLSLPLPIRLAGWASSLARPFMAARWREAGLEVHLLAVEGALSPENPLHVEMWEAQRDEHMRLYIG